MYRIDGNASCFYVGCLSFVLCTYIYRGIMYHECVHLLCALCCTPDVVEHVLVAAVLRVREHHLACGQWNI